MLDAGRVPIFFDKTPSFLASLNAAISSSRLLPFARLLVMLREPVARMHSHVMMGCTRAHRAVWGLYPAVSTGSGTADVQRLCIRTGPNPKLPRCSTKDADRVVDAPCTPETFAKLQGAFAEAYRLRESEGGTQKYGLEGIMLFRSLYKQQLIRWLNAHGRGNMIVFNEDLASHITVLWPLIMWHLGFDVPGAELLLDKPEQEEEEERHPMPTMPDSALDLLHPTRRTLYESSGKTVLSDTVDKLTNSIFCERNRWLAQLLAPVPFPDNWGCTSLEDRGSGDASDNQAAAGGKRYVRIPVSSEYVSGAERRKPPQDRKRMGEWHVFRVPFTQQLANAAKDTAKGPAAESAGRTHVWAARFVVDRHR